MPPQDAGEEGNGDLRDADRASGQDTGRDEPRWRAALREWFVDERAAWAFLTVLPVPAAAPVWPRVMRAFPWVGGLIGTLCAAVMLIASLMGLSPLPAALLAVLGGLLITGAMHEDGLADFADALGGGDRERRLAIMRDPRSGSFAVLALILAVLLPAAALSTITERRGLAAALLALVVAHAVSRAGMVWLMSLLPPARAEGQGATAGRPDAGVRRIALFTGLLLAVVLLLPPFGPLAVLSALLAAAWAVMLVATLARRLLGGLTGDVAGAAEVLARSLFLLLLSAAHVLPVFPAPR